MKHASLLFIHVSCLDDVWGQRSDVLRLVVVVNSWNWAPEAADGALCWQKPGGAAAPTCSVSLVLEPAVVTFDLRQQISSKNKMGKIDDNPTVLREE